MFKKRKKDDLQNSNLEGFCENYISLCIWGDGPGRPHDNSYLLTEKKMDVANNRLTLFFDGNEKCTLVNPIDVVWNGKLFTAKSADRIIWEFYYY